MTVETVRDWLTNLHENLREEGKRVGRPDNIAAAVDATITAVKQAAEISGILDARIIRGTADAPVWVIEPAAWEVARGIVTAWIRRFSRDTEAQHEQNIDEVTAAVLQAFLLGARVAEEIRVVFDGPPGAESGRFVEVETADGKSVNAGQWYLRKDGLWELCLQAVLPDGEEV